MRKIFWMMVLAIAAVACSESEAPTPEQFEKSQRNLLIGCEGNYGAANATLSCYTPEEKVVENEVFMRANGQLLGDVAQSLTMHDGLCWVAANSSGVIFAIDPTTFKEVKRIVTPNPRHIHFLSDEKAYVTALWDNRIAIVNPKNCTTTGYITTEMEAATASTEQMVQVGKYLFVNCWSYQRQVLKIDTESDQIVGTLEVGIQPACITADKNGKLWVLCDGGQWDGNPLGYEAPSLLRIDPEKFEVELTLKMNLGEFPAKLQCNAAGDRLYWLNGGVWSMSVDSESLPTAAAFATGLASEYGMTICPESEEIYVSDAVDYSQPGVVARFTKEGTLIDSFTVGICPGTFAWSK